MYLLLFLINLKHHCWIKVIYFKNISCWHQTSEQLCAFHIFDHVYLLPKIRTGLQIVSLTHISSFGDLKVYRWSRFPLFPPLQVVQESELWQCRAVAHHLLLSVQSCSRMPPKTPAERRNMTCISVERWITDIWWIWSSAVEFQDISVLNTTLWSL